MPAKLFINKIDTFGDIKTLQVTIESGETCEKVLFGEWLKESNPNKIQSTKSSRLIVKIVSGPESNNFEFDLFAREVSGFPSNSGFLNDDRGVIRSNTMLMENMSPYTHSINSIGTLSNTEISMSPLEHSLERVKENNARIMENIHILNRTLTYTKRKEVMDILCPKSMRSFSCSYCGKGFVYETGLRRHHSTSHAISEFQPRWQVVWTCIECYQVWPGYDLATNHSSNCRQNDKADTLREIKTSLLLQCEFCEKVYTSIPRLLKHSKSHSTVRNYECHACDEAFINYKAAEQHWLRCPWLKTCYTFTLPKMLLCNGCDKKFRTYDHLYSHRYKARHFLTKLQKNSAVMQFEIWVYQCETCGLQFGQTAQLLTHKKYIHPHSEEINGCDL